jgi:hypothetical protein
LARRDQRTLNFRCRRLDSLGFCYRNRTAAIAGKHLPGRVGLDFDGLTGRFLPWLPAFYLRA